MLLSAHAPRLDSYFNRLLEEELSPCLSIGYSDNSRELQYAFTGGCSAPKGYERAAIDGRTRFNVGSVTKIVTASLIVKLIEEGLLTLHTPVRSVIPDYLFPDVTVWHLLTHTAGYEGFDEPWPSREDAGAYLRRIYAIDSRSYSPGESQIYFTQGYTIIMDMIEKLTGRSLEVYAREMLFDPLEMRDTTFETSLLQEGTFVLPWNYETGSGRNDLRHAAVTGDSGLYSTVSDLMRFAQLFLHAGKVEDKIIFSSAGVDLMLREATGGRFSKTPIAWRKSDIDPHGCFGDLQSPSCIGHPGFTGCMLTIDPHYERIGVILSNSPRLHSDWSNYNKIWNKLMTL
ncbi:serine hydrolase domain-containing protein [Cohnella soli]|uniref:Serine hydrolase domain-containing protein n=1 Tax=Cohnella soli TaxID=425005 RepID=A0ABW0HZZ1_9BACL